MRSVVRAAYSGKCNGSNDKAVALSWASGSNRPRLASPRKAIKPMTTTIATASQRVAISRTKAKGSDRFIVRWPGHSNFIAAARERLVVIRNIRVDCAFIFLTSAGCAHGILGPPTLTF